ncbi:MAG: hypothetical protein KatS3mg032_0671 [Cyclobacteriaceae bacterium]|nr:MAG: hypothetical protein KatS3mg032_0671 [Cyclobacteriaceae bacterium]
MISVTSQAFDYILQPALITMHRETRSWQSAATLWKRELVFFQKILEQHNTTTCKTSGNRLITSSIS